MSVPEQRRGNSGKRYTLTQKLAIKSLLDTGKTPTEIEREEKIDRSTVYEVMKDQRISILEKKHVDNVKRSLIGNTYGNAWRAQQKISDAKLEAMNALQLMTISAIGIDKGRLMEGLSTENVSHRGVVENIESDRKKLMDEIEKLRND